MRLALSEEQRRFGRTLHEMLARAPVEEGPGPGRRLWAALGAAGVTGLAIPERHGGSAAGADDVVVACEQLGRHAVAGPVAESIAAVPLLLAGRDEPHDELLAGLAEGRVIASLAVEPWLPFALDGDDVDLLLLVDGDVVRSGRAGAVHQSMDPARRLAEVLPGPVVGGDGVGRALDLGMLACAAQLLGAGRTLLDMSIEHARTRTQFGRSIGSFQALRHRLADVAVAIDFARPLLYAAAVALDMTDERAAARGGAEPAADLDGGRDVSAAKISCGEAALLAARTALQVHGAIGYTAEHRLGRYLTLVRALHLSWGTPGWHRQRVLASIVGATAGDPTPPPTSCLGAASRGDVTLMPRDGPGSAGAGVGRTKEEGSE
jgi:alkylation response protein AidB-like acyl-CoA dehydrogenase